MAGNYLPAIVFSCNVGNWYNQVIRLPSLLLIRSGNVNFHHTLAHLFLDLV